MAKANRKGCLVGVGIIAFVGILGVSWWNQQDNMGSDTEFESIVAPATPKPLPPIREADNWYPLIKSFTTKIPSPDLRTDDIPESVFQGKDGQAILNLSRAIAKRPFFETPRKSASDFDLTYGPSVRAFAKFLCVHARRSFASGDWQTALEDLEIVDHIGTTAAERGVLIDWLIGRAVNFIGNRELADALLAGNVPKAKCIELSSRPITDRREEYLQALRREISAYSMSTLRTGRSPNSAMAPIALEVEKDPTFFDPDTHSEMDPLFFGRLQRIETARTFAKILQAIDEDVRATYATSPSRAEALSHKYAKLRRPFTASTAPDSLQSKWEILRYRAEVRSRSNEKGLIILDLMPLSYGDPERNARTQDVFLRLSAAIGAFRLDHKRFPTSLDQLVQARLLKEVPLDPFDGAPIRYDPARKILWSVGADCRDDNGEAGKDRLWRLTPRPIPPLPPTGPSPGWPR